MGLSVISCTRKTPFADHKDALLSEISATSRVNGGDPYLFSNFGEVYEFTRSSIGSRLLRVNDILVVVEAQACQEANDCFRVIDFIQNNTYRLLRPIIVYEVGVSHSCNSWNNKALGQNEIIAKGYKSGYGLVRLEGDLDSKVIQIRNRVPEQIELSILERELSAGGEIGRHATLRW